MSEPDLLTRFVVALEKIAEGITGAKVAVSTAGAAGKSTAGAAAGAAAAGAAAGNKPAAGAAAGKSTAGAAAGKSTAGAASGNKPKPSAAAGTKGPAGKHSLDDVRAIIRSVATNAALGKPEALNILDEEGGVTNVADLKPENYDAVYEACEVAIANAGKPAAATDEEDPLADL